MTRAEQETPKFRVHKNLQEKSGKNQDIEEAVDIGDENKSKDN